ncbi:MAG: DNA polymerase ligase N-terminal domain-containing protein [Phycisphaerae bacterium]
MTRRESDNAARSTGRFVVLHHLEATGDHYDLMIENGDRLATWKMIHPPERMDTKSPDTRRIQDHRPVYLDYEGPISGDRGQVTRHDSGGCVVHERGEARWVLTFDGRRLKGGCILECVDQSEARWRLRRVEA